MCVCVLGGGGVMHLSAQNVVVVFFFQILGYFVMAFKHVVPAGALTVLKMLS